MAVVLPIARVLPPCDSTTRSTRRIPAALLAAVAAAALLCACDRQDSSAAQNFEGDAKRGKALIGSLGCGGCHLIPHVANADGNVGPPLLHVGSRVYIAGFLRNSPDNMALWLQNPQKVLPGNAMPAMGISQKDSRDIAAYLYTLR